MSAGRYPAHLLFSSSFQCYLWTFFNIMQHRVIQGEETVFRGSPSRRALTKRSSCVLKDWPRVGHSGPRSSRWGSGLRSIGRQWQRKQASFILWRWSSVGRDQSTTPTLINSFIEERLQEALLMHTLKCVVFFFTFEVFTWVVFSFCVDEVFAAVRLFYVCSAIPVLRVTLPVLSVCTEHSSAAAAAAQNTKHPSLCSKGFSSKNRNVTQYIRITDGCDLAVIRGSCWLTRSCGFGKTYYKTSWDKSDKAAFWVS